MNTEKRFISFIALLAFCAITFWLSGYDFDHRSEEVAFGFACSFMFAFLIAMIP